MGIDAAKRKKGYSYKRGNRREWELLKEESRKID